MARLRRFMGAVGMLLLTGVWLGAAGVLADGKPERGPLQPPGSLVEQFCGADLGSHVTDVYALLRDA